MTINDIKALTTKSLWEELHGRMLGESVETMCIVEELQRRMDYPTVFLLISGSGDDGDEERIESVHATEEAAEKTIRTFPKQYQSNFSIDERDVEP